MFPNTLFHLRFGLKFDKIKQKEKTMKNLSINTVFAATAAVVGAGLIALAISHNTNNFNSVNVTGECIKKVPKDRTAVVIEVKNTEQTNTTATKKSMDTYQKVSDSVISMKNNNPKIELETESIDSNQKYEWDGKQKKSVLVGYESIVRLKITSDKQEEISKILGEVTKYKDVYTGSLSTFTSRQLMKSEQEACIEEATKNAREKAIALADGGKTKLGRMISASFHQSVGNASNTGGMVRYAKAAVFEQSIAADSAAGGPQIFSGDNDISVTVNASFELR